MRILLGHRRDVWRERVVQNYSECLKTEFQRMGVEVISIGENQEIQTLEQAPSQADLILEVETGRNSDGSFNYLVPKRSSHRSVPTAVWFIDSHGHPSMHRNLAPYYDHVFFAVYSKRDLFVNCKSSNWLPNATDFHWFNRDLSDVQEPTIQFGFFGSKGGLHRAEPLKKVCEKNGYSYDIRQVSKPYRHKWPHTGEEMSKCQFLFNWGQKLDGPNQRVFESMAVGRLLLNDRDARRRDGTEMLFEEGKHYLGYDRYTFADLEEKMQWALNNPKEVGTIVENAYKRVAKLHTIQHRAQEILLKTIGWTKQ